MSAHQWAWRSFGTNFGPAEKLIRQHATEARSSHETYLVSERSDVCATISDGVLDVTTLTAVAPNGVEQWTPLLGGTFPLATSLVDQLFATWRLPVPQTIPPPITQREFIQLLDQVAADIRMVPVTRLRHRGSLCGSSVEIAELIVDGRSLRTVAVEGADPRHVMKTVMLLNLDECENVNYVKQLQRSMVVAPQLPAQPPRELGR